MSEAHVGEFTGACLTVHWCHFGIQVAKTWGPHFACQRQMDVSLFPNLVLIVKTALGKN